MPKKEGVGGGGGAERFNRVVKFTCGQYAASDYKRSRQKYEHSEDRYR